MDSQKISLWVQFLTGLAVLVGLALVIWELQQARELARAQLASDGWNEIMATARSSLSETFAVARHKSCVSPNELSDSEIQEMLSYFHILRSEAVRMRGYSNIGSYEVAWRELAKNNVGIILGHTVGRVQYELGKGFWWPWYEEMAEEMISNDEVRPCADYLTPILKAVRTESDGKMDVESPPPDR